MKLELGIAAVGCLILAFGHASVGLQVLPGLRKGMTSSTWFGPPALTVGMLRFTWNLVTLMLLAFAGMFSSLAFVARADPETLLLRWFAIFWLAATALAIWNARRRLSSLLRLPVPLVTLAIALLCWKASA